MPLDFVLSICLHEGIKHIFAREREREREITFICLKFFIQVFDLFVVIIFADFLKKTMGMNLHMFR